MAIKKTDNLAEEKVFAGFFYGMHGQKFFYTFVSENGGEFQMELKKGGWMSCTQNLTTTFLGILGRTFGKVSYAKLEKKFRNCLAQILQLCHLLGMELYHCCCLRPKIRLKIS